MSRFYDASGGNRPKPVLSLPQGSLEAGGLHDPSTMCRGRRGVVEASASMLEARGLNPPAASPLLAAASVVLSRRPLGKEASALQKTYFEVADFIHCITEAA